LWHSGDDPDNLLDPGRLLDLEASLRLDQRRFDEALALLDQALPMSHHPGRVLINKGFTLEVMGDYEAAVLALLQAEPKLDRAAQPRLWYQQRFNLAACYCHLGRHRDADELVKDVRSVASGLEDQIFLIRVLGMEARIAAGLGRIEEAKALFEQARAEFAARCMNYDVALATLELAVLLLAEGRTGEVKELAEKLAVVFDANGVHREALAALRLFHEAAQREAATAELARRVLSYLFRARHDEGLRFEE
jgi:tetratricopeptide (TPR) repeat protein